MKKKMLFYEIQVLLGILGYFSIYLIFKSFRKKANTKFQQACVL